MARADLVVLDTHTWIWWVTGSKKLSVAARKAIEGARRVGLPAVCCWETAMLVSSGRLRIDRDVRHWVHQALETPKLDLLDLLPDIAVTAGSIASSFHGDPIDRLIVATAMEHRAPLVSADSHLAGWPGLEVVW